ncbi:MAG: hypothetical protein ABSF23_16005 [Terracidiphilus sp.]|jgi:hypothetical protein
MIRILLAPSVIFISPQVWDNDLGRDSALQLMLDYLDEVENLRVTTILWCDELEALLWSDPVLPPWRMDRDWRIKLVPVIAKKFRRATTLLRLSVACVDSTFMPPDSLPSVRGDITQAFCQLSHQAALELAELIICLEGAHDIQPPTSFQCTACALDTTVRSVSSPKRLAADREIAAEFWDSAEVRSAADIDHLLSLALRWQDSILTARYRASYSNSFKAKVASAANKGAIFEAMAKRISKTENEATHDHGLHDEPVRGKESKGIRRFRVSVAERIQYDYQGEQEIRFLDYFPEGHHDGGL